MCTMITTRRSQGSGKGASGWFDLREANVSYDHPYHIRMEHALNIDFVNEAEGPGARVAVELSPESARAAGEGHPQRLRSGGVGRLGQETPER